MASVTSFRVRKRLAPLCALVSPIARSLEHAPVPLLALRLPEFERIAWRSGRRAAQRLERRTIDAFNESAAVMLRRGDIAAHDRASDIFAIAMTARSRERHAPLPADVRAVLERVAAAIALLCDLRVEVGWTMLCGVDERGDLHAEIAQALERGARERERYEFFSAIGHELRTPLTSIRGYLETLLDEDVDPGTARRFMETARREALRMARLLDGMFEFSLLDLGGGLPVPRTCDIGAQVRQACDVVAPLAAQRGIRIEAAAEPGVRGALDADACLQMLVNLLDNAIKYGRENGVVRVSVCKRETGAVVIVDDDGPGVASDERESIFALRVRGATAAVRPGTGIGLAIVKTIAERAGGRIGVAQSPLGGARFEATLPLALQD